MKVLITTAVWGDDYIRMFVEYSAASLLAPGNLPRLAKDHEITWQVIAPLGDLENFHRSPAAARLRELCDVEEISFESLGLSEIPRGMNMGKYNFLSQLQNHAIRSSLAHDAIVFNYADFVWADGSLTHCIRRLDGEPIDAVMSFCLPVDLHAGKKALDPYRLSSAPHCIVLPPRACAAVAIDNLHREARLRMWDGDEFTTTPTYILWRVGDEGLVVHSYHLTALVLRVKPQDADYARGIQEGTLDGHFSTIVGERWPFAIADDSDQVVVFSLYQTTINTALSDPLTREDSVYFCLVYTSRAQRLMANTPILVKRNYHDAELWDRVVRDSSQVVQNFRLPPEFKSPTLARLTRLSIHLTLALNRRLVQSSLGPPLKAALGTRLRAKLASVMTRNLIRAERLLESRKGPSLRATLIGALGRRFRLVLARAKGRNPIRAEALFESRKPDMKP